MTKDKIKKQELYTEIKVLQAKVEKLFTENQDLQTRVKVLEAGLDTRLKQKYYGASTGCLACGKYDCPAAITNLPCPKGVPYCLSSGSLSDAGTTQTWRPSGDVNL